MSAKEVKKLKHLELLDLSHNKLWYLSQVIALKDLAHVKI
jgi:hypothetical protein